MRFIAKAPTSAFPYLAKQLNDTSPYPIWKLFCKGECEPEEDNLQEIGERIKRELNGAPHDPHR